MKTRAEIYSKEAADILRNITTYHYMRHDQLLRLYPGKEEKIDNLLSFFLRQGRIFRDEHSGLYHDGTEAHADKEMLAALWVLTDFIDRVDYHSSTDFPVKLIFIADGELYEVIYVETGGEAPDRARRCQAAGRCRKTHRHRRKRRADRQAEHPRCDGVLHRGYEHRRCSVL